MNLIFFSEAKQTNKHHEVICLGMAARWLERSRRLILTRPPGFAFNKNGRRFGIFGGIFGVGWLESPEIWDRNVFWEFRCSGLTWSKLRKFGEAPNWDDSMIGCNQQRLGVLEVAQVASCWMMRCFFLVFWSFKRGYGPPDSCETASVPKLACCFLVVSMSIFNLHVPDNRNS